MATRRGLLRLGGTLAATAGSALALSACGSPQGGTPANTGNPQSLPPATIRFHHRGGTIPSQEPTLYAEQLPLFQAKFPNIKVAEEGFTGEDYYTKITVLSAGGSVWALPDVPAVPPCGAPHAEIASALPAVAASVPPRRRIPLRVDMTVLVPSIRAQLGFCQKPGGCIIPPERQMGKSIGAGYQEPSTLEADPDLLDPQIRPLVHALNQTTWARTIFSCAGHPEEPNSVNQGRRQAHIDLLVADLPRWQSYVRSIPRPPNIRITEGPLGPIPAWLADGGFGGYAPAGPGEARQNQLGVQGSAASPGRRSLSWHYRRLVIEPNPYAMPPDRCRATLDAALHTATSTLQSPTPHTSHANTH